MLINPKKSWEKNGLFWVGQEGGFRLHLNNSRQGAGKPLK